MVFDSQSPWTRRADSSAVGTYQGTRQIAQSGVERMRLSTKCSMVEGSGGRSQPIFCSMVGSRGSRR